MENLRVRFNQIDHRLVITESNPALWLKRILSEPNPEAVIAQLEVDVLGKEAELVVAQAATPRGQVEALIQNPGYEIRDAIALIVANFPKE